MNQSIRLASSPHSSQRRCDIEKARILTGKFGKRAIFWGDQSMTGYRNLEVKWQDLKIQREKGATLPKPTK